MNESMDSDSVKISIEYNSKNINIRSNFRQDCQRDT